MEIHRFTEAHLEQAAEIAAGHWGKETPSVAAQDHPLLFNYLVRYYFHPESAFSLAAVENGVLCGFLLAHLKSAGTNRAGEWLEPRLTPENRPAFERYCAYIDGNCAREMRAAGDREIILSLFASRRKGCGGLLMREFETACRASGVPSMVLWTDETCDFDWYSRNGFEEAARAPTFPALDGRQLTTYIFRKHF